MTTEGHNEAEERYDLKEKKEKDNGKRKHCFLSLLNPIL